jgi:hypothetical protein
VGFVKTDSLAEVLAHPEGNRILTELIPGIINAPMAQQLAWMPVGNVVMISPAVRDDGDVLDRLWSRLAALSDSAAEAPAEAGYLDVDPDYEPETVPTASASLTAPATVDLRGRVELVLQGPSHGNPFTDVELTATVTGRGTSRTVGGFYDGNGTWRIRFLADAAGDWSFTTTSNARSLDGHTGTVTCTDQPASRGHVVVADTFHFRYADGTRYLPIGTTAYAWTHQTDALENATLNTLATSPFNKLRMCVFPKAYLFNANEPSLYPFEGSLADSWDFTRFNPAYFRKLETRIEQLAELGIEADLILFHAYDRWGFAKMGAAADDRFVSYLVRRLAAHPSVWWSLANEYDLLPWKSIDDWERLAAVVTANDPVGHLLSIHNCFGFYDYSKPWITHSSVQRVDVYRTSENTDAWRNEWRKPVVIDECAYEGDIDQGWGNITGEEMVRRFWEGAVRGGYVGHGETYLNDREELWWSKGGELVGSSPNRIRFLADLIAEAPGGVLDPLPSDWDVPWAGVAGQYYLLYLGFGQPRYRNIVLPPGQEYVVDVIDTWNMTVERLEGTVEGFFQVPLPGRQFMAVRVTAVQG